MAKKRAYSSAPAKKKKVSVKKIVESIDKALGELEGNRARTASPSREIERARKALLAARDAVESACLPEFYVPAE
jgi:hypothetical protein